MKVLLGWMNEEHGTVETTPSGLVYVGPDPDHVRELLEGQRRWWDRSGVLHTLSDPELVRSLPYRLQGHLWAVFVDPKTGLTQDQPPYDPWGDVWYAHENRGDFRRPPRLAKPLPPNILPPPRYDREPH